MNSIWPSSCNVTNQTRRLRMTFKIIDARQVNGQVEAVNTKTNKRVFIKIKQAVKNGQIVRL